MYLSSPLRLEDLSCKFIVGSLLKRALNSDGAPAPSANRTNIPRSSPSYDDIRANVRPSSPQRQRLWPCLPRVVVSVERALSALPLPPGELRRLRAFFDDYARWTRKHGCVLADPAAYFDDLLLAPDGSILSLAVAERILQQYADHDEVEDSVDARKRLTPATAFHLTAFYALREAGEHFWARIDATTKRRYLAERCTNFDAIVLFWTGLISRQEWLSDSYLVRAFYWAAEFDCVEAFAFIWAFGIRDQRVDAVSFRCVRAFQLATVHGNFDVLLYLWHEAPAQREEMIQGVLSSTPGAFFSLEGASANGCTRIIDFLFREASVEQTKLIIRAEDCSSFRLAAGAGHTEICSLFVRGADSVGLKRTLYLAEDGDALRRVLVNGDWRTLELLLAASTPDIRRALLAMREVRAAFTETTATGVNDGDVRFWTGVGAFWSASTAHSDERGVLLSEIVLPALVRSGDVVGATSALAESFVVNVPMLSEHVLSVDDFTAAKRRTRELFELYVATVNTLSSEDDDDDEEEELIRHICST